jgi:hypothetical protein
MNEPYRLRENCDSPLERSLLDAGVAYRSPLSARAKTLAALGLAGTAAVSAGTASAASTSIAAKAGWSWTKLLAVSGLGAAAAVPAGYYAWELATAQAEPPSITAPYVAPVNAPTPGPKAQLPEVAPVVEAPVVEAPVVEAPVVEAPAPVHPAPKADVRSSSSSPSALAAELAALDIARSRLNAGDANGALLRLDEYTRAYPRGRLALEAEVLRIDALSRSGQRAAAAKRAATFLKRHPNSVLASRVRAYLGD